MWRSETGFGEWQGSAQNCAFAEIESFARALEQDKSAVLAAIKYEWRLNWIYSKPELYIKLKNKAPAFELYFYRNLF